MANDIAHFFEGASDGDAVILGMANHMKSFWTTRMRRKLISELQLAGSDEDLPREALKLLEEPRTSVFAINDPGGSKLRLHAKLESSSHIGP